MPSSVPAAKAGLRDYLRSVEGLRASDGVTVRGAPVAPAEATDKQIILGDVVAPQAERAGLARKKEKPTLTCWLRVTRPGADDQAEDMAREDAAGLLALVQQAITADPTGTAGGAITPPGGVMVGESELQEYPVDLEGAAGRGAQYRFTITWESHVV
jgi:hypothetical protein